MPTRPVDRSTPRESIARLVLHVIDAARLLRPRTREVEQLFRAVRRFRDGSRDWTDAQKQSWVLDRLRAQVQYASASAPFWRDRFRAIGFDPESPFTFDDFAQIPVLTRDDVLQAGEAMLSSRVPAAARRRDSTGGSTGTPLTYYAGPAETAWRISGQDWWTEQIGLARETSTALLWGHHIDRGERTRRATQLYEWLMGKQWFDCFRLSSDVLLGYHEQMQRMQPSVILAYASALDALASTLEERSIAPQYPLRSIITGAEKLWPHQRDRAERVFGVSVHERYGGRDVGQLAVQLDPKNSLDFTVDWANALVEPAQSTSDAEILVTKLHADAMPMFRYRVGDVGRFPEGARPGFPTLVLREVLGRQVDRLYLPNGQWMHGLGVPHLMKDFPIREFQLRQDADFRVVLLVVPTENFAANDERRALDVLRQNLPGLDLRVERVSEIPRTAASKWRPVVSMVTPPSHSESAA